MKYRNSIAAGTALMAVLAAFTANFESGGAKPHLTAYLDQGGVATICHGITGPDIHLGMTVTPEWCQKRYELELEKHSKPLDKVPYQMKPESRVAWADFCFNVGTGACSSSTAFRRLVAGGELTSCDGFLAWRYTTVNGVKRDCSKASSKCMGIWIRRNAERDLCQGRIMRAEFDKLTADLPRGGELE